MTNLEFKTIKMLHITILVADEILNKNPELSDLSEMLHQDIYVLRDLILQNIREHIVGDILEENNNLGTGD